MYTHTHKYIIKRVYRSYYRVRALFWPWTRHLTCGCLSFDTGCPATTLPCLRYQFGRWPPDSSVFLFVLKLNADFFAMKPTTSRYRCERGTCIHKDKDLPLDIYRPLMGWGATAFPGFSIKIDIENTCPMEGGCPHCTS